MAASEDELAQTESDPSAPVKKPAEGVRETLGRYRIERMLGEGGMGVVHAAFDPDLERRVALKVLRTTDEGGDARQRLLREARAMARLTHANVVTVHEVGSASGRDYVAMELIEGETLADWLRGSKRERREIVAAFVAAGRGLAAAHAAGLVHRDFKPHNVLRRRDGHVVVTDFGLARGVEASLAFEATMDLKSDSANTPSALSGITRTGSVLGTPAYMAPEQWKGASVGPPADQFAFCVALWEALAGSRPYRGGTFDELKSAVTAGPDTLDASKLPRALRQPLLRGLDPDPDRRWPSMDALLAAIVRAERRPAFALFAAAGLVVIGAIVFVLMRHSASGTAASPCQRPARDANAVWPADASKAVAASGRGELAAAIDRDVAAWRAARAEACTAHDAPRLACLDGSLARVDVIHRAIEKVTGDIEEAAIESLVDPAVCKPRAAPRLTLEPTPDTIAAFAMLLDGTVKDHKATADDARALATKPNVEPCVRTVALRAEALLAAEPPARKAALLDSITAADACGDDRLRADTLVEEAPYESETPVAGPRGHAAVEKAKVAVEHVAQADLVAQLDEQRAELAAQDERWDDAFAVAESAIAGYGARNRPRAQIGAVEIENNIRFLRGSIDDMNATRAAVAKWKPIAEQIHATGLVHALEMTDAYARVFLGDLEGGHAEILRLYKPRPVTDGMRIDGVVIDEHGAPVANATIAVARSLFVDSIGPLPFGQYSDMRSTTTDATGAFAIDDAPKEGTVIAQTDAHHRSAPQTSAQHMKIVLAPTRKLAGKAVLGTTARTKCFVMATAFEGAQVGGYLAMSPIKPDGTFSIDGVTTAAVKIGVTIWGAQESANVTFVQIPAGPDKLDLVLAAPNTGRTLDVIVRSAVATSLDTAQVYLLPGKADYKVGGDLMTNRHLASMQVQFAKPLIGDAIPEAARSKTRPGDLIAHFSNVLDGEITVCAVGINGDFSDPAFAKSVQSHSKELAMKCVTPAANETALVVETPPQKRFD